MLHQIQGDVPAVHQAAEAAIALSQEQGFPHWLSMGRMLQGWATALQTPDADGLEQLKSGLAAWRATGSELLRSYFLSLLASAQQKTGQVEEGLRTLNEALESVEEHGERFYEAELYRLKGEGLLMQQIKSQRSKVKGQKFKKLRTDLELRTQDSGLRTDSAEECFQRAIDIARRQGAKSLELRAAMSLGGLWQGQGREAEARQLVAEVYEWFSEGFATPDLQQAKALLEQGA
jgi:predicted ATPase